MADVAEIVRLVAVSRGATLAIFGLSPKRWRASHNKRRQPFYALHMLAPHLCEMRLRRRLIGGCDHQFRLTPLGLAVREHLAADQSNISQENEHGE